MVLVLVLLVLVMVLVMVPPKKNMIYFTTGSAMNKTFLMSREKFLGNATIKFGNDGTYLLSKRRVTLMHTPVPTAIDHTTATVYEQRQNEIEAKEFRAEFRKLRNNCRKLYGKLWD